MSDEKPEAQTAMPPSVPPWVYGLSMMLGMPLVGGGGAYLGNTQAQQDIAKLEVKVDKLDSKIDTLLLGFVRAHPQVPLDKP